MIKDGHYNPDSLVRTRYVYCISEPRLGAHQDVYEMLCGVEVLRETILTETVLAGKAQINRFNLCLSADARHNQRHTWGSVKIVYYRFTA